MENIYKYTKYKNKIIYIYIYINAYIYIYIFKKIIVLLIQEKKRPEIEKKN